MALDYPTLVRKRFENVGPKNPLRGLSDHDKCFLTALLEVYARAPESDKLSDTLEEAAGIAAEAGSLAGKIESRFLSGPLAEMLGLYIGSSRDLPARLATFSKSMGAIIDNLVGKRGHKGKTSRNRFLIMASEFVRLKTGKHYDEHLAELMQTINPSIDFDGDDISGDSIRKKRVHLKKTYALLYGHTVRLLQTRYMGSSGKPKPR